MCVIIIVPKGVELPSNEELRMAYNRNHDGCGFVTKSDHYKTLHFGAFLRRLSKRKIDEGVIIHFRLATHGSIKVKNCHPFYKNRFWFAHNGVLPIPTVNDMTDSQICFNTSIYPCIKKFGWDSPELDVEMAYWSRCGSKFAIMHDGEIKMFGKFIERRGCYYSNLYHLQYNRYIV